MMAQIHNRTFVIDSNKSNVDSHTVEHNLTCASPASSLSTMSSTKQKSDKLLQVQANMKQKICQYKNDLVKVKRLKENVVQMRKDTASLADDFLLIDKKTREIQVSIREIKEKQEHLRHVKEIDEYLDRTLQTMENHDRGMCLVPYRTSMYRSNVRSKTKRDTLNDRRSNRLDTTPFDLAQGWNHINRNQNSRPGDLNFRLQSLSTTCPRGSTKSDTSRERPGMDVSRQSLLARKRIFLSRSRSRSRARRYFELDSKETPTSRGQDLDKM